MQDKTRGRQPDEDQPGLGWYVVITMDRPYSLVTNDDRLIENASQIKIGFLSLANAEKAADRLQVSIERGPEHELPVPVLQGEVIMPPDDRHSDGSFRYPVNHEPDRRSKPAERRSCPDNGTCHHSCGNGGCFRVYYASPLSGVYPDDCWPAGVTAEEHELSRQAGHGHL